MSTQKQHRKWMFQLALGAGIALLAAAAKYVMAADAGGAAYTQSGVGIGIANGIPMGHEWVTRMAAIELLGYAPPTDPDIPDPNDPRKVWTQGLAKNTNLSDPGAQDEVQRIKGLSYNDQRYASRYKPVYDSIIGERWVDIAGYNILNGKLYGTDCWDAVAQEPVEVQYDHFMRRYDDRDGAGGVTATKTSQQRFVTYFVGAAMAGSVSEPRKTISVYDGGATASTAVDVDLNYFAFGRAVHLFEDSFSSEHTVRIPADNYTRVRQVKSYLCAPGSEQHTHSTTKTIDYTSGDVIWLPGSGCNPSWSTYKPSLMKTGALVATEATKDLWAAFIRTMGTPRQQRPDKAQAEAATLVNNWLSYDEQEMNTWYNDETHRDSSYVLAQNQSGGGQTVQACMTGLGVGTSDQLAYAGGLQQIQRMCLYNVLPTNPPTPANRGLFDSSMHIWFSWGWRNQSRYEQPPQGWQIPSLSAGDIIPVRVNAFTVRSSDSASSLVYYYKTDPQIPPSFAPAAAPSFLGFSFPAPGTVPVYVYTLPMTDPNHTLVYFYSTDPKTPPSFTAAGIAFYAYSQNQPRTVPVYLFTKKSSDSVPTLLYYYSSKDDQPSGYNKGGAIFWAPPSL